MKRIWGVLSILLGIGAAVIFVNVKTESHKEGEIHRVAAIIPADQEHFWQGVWTGVREKAEEYGIWLSEYPYSTDEGEEAVAEKLETVILSKVDGILLCSNQYSLKETQELLKKAKKKGIKIVLCDSDAEEAMRDCFVGVDNEKAGKLGARTLMEHTKVRKVLLIQKKGERISEASRQRKEAFKAGIGETGIDVEIEQLELEEDSEGYYKEVQEILLSSKEGCAVVCFNSASTLLMAQTVQRLNLKDSIMLMGFCETDEALEYVENGIIDILLTQDNEGLGAAGISVMQTLLSGGKPLGQVFSGDMTVITGETIEKFL